jgi:general secretion pathway protein G
MSTSRPGARGPAARRSRTAGFTLIEIMVVVMILGLLATLVVTSVTDSSDVAREEKARTDVRTLAGAARLYYSQYGRRPAALADLLEPDAKDRRFLEELPRDPWQHDYVLREGAKPREFEVVSAGQDGQLGSADDISSRSAP